MYLSYDFHHREVLLIRRHEDTYTRYGLVMKSRSIFCDMINYSYYNCLLAASTYAMSPWYCSKLSVQTRDTTTLSMHPVYRTLYQNKIGVNLTCQPKSVSWIKKTACNSRLFTPWNPVNWSSPGRNPSHIMTKAVGKPLRKILTYDE